MTRTPLSHLAELTSGFAFSSQFFNEKVGTPLIRIRDVIEGTTSLKFAGEYDERFLVQKGDLLITMDGEFRIAEWRGGPALLNQRVCRIEPKNGAIDPNFLKHFLPKKLKEIEDHTPFVTVKHLSVKRINSIEVPNISLVEQRRIAAILNKADGICRKRESALAMTDEFLNSAFLKMFGDPSTNPMGWPTATLAELGKVQGGLQVTKTRDTLNLRLPYLRVANVYRDRLDLGEMKQIGLTPAEFERTKLEVGDILIVEGHGNPEEIGRAAVWNGLIDPCVHQNHLIRFRANHTIVSPLYVSRVLNSAGGRLQLVGAGRTTSGLNTISTSKVKEVWVPVPPLPVQQKFEEIARRQDMTSRLLDADLKTSGELFASLSQRAFRGEL